MRVGLSLMKINHGLTLFYAVKSQYNKNNHGFTTAFTVKP